MLNDKDAEWLASFYGQRNGQRAEPPEPLTHEPPLKQFELRPCWICGALVDRELCGYCEFRFIDDYPALAAMRRDVRDRGELSEWDEYNHTDMQTNHQFKPGYWQGWRGFVATILSRAYLRGFGRGLHRSRPMFFHPEYFGEDEAA